MTTANSTKKSGFAATFAVLFIALSGCGGSQHDANRAIEDGTLAARWADTQYTVALFAEHCAKIDAGQKGAKASVIDSEVRKLVKRASLSTTERQSQRASAELAKAVDAISCEPDAADDLATAPR